MKPVGVTDPGSSWWECNLVAFSGMERWLPGGIISPIHLWDGFRHAPDLGWDIVKAMLNVQPHSEMLFSLPIISLIVMLRIFLLPPAHQEQLMSRDGSITGHEFVLDEEVDNLTADVIFSSSPVFLATCGSTFLHCDKWFSCSCVALLKVRSFTNLSGA